MAGHNRQIEFLGRAGLDYPGVIADGPARIGTISWYCSQFFPAESAYGQLRLVDDRLRTGGGQLGRGPVLVNALHGMSTTEEKRG
jgi:hypothetical protein